jgi:branched-subunit amino acid transport protein
LNYTFLRQQAWYRRWRWAINGLYAFSLGAAAVFVATIGHGPLASWEYFVLALIVTTGLAYATKRALLVTLAGPQALAEELVEAD